MQPQTPQQAPPQPVPGDNTPEVGTGGTAPQNDGASGAAVTPATNAAPQGFYRPQQEGVYVEPEIAGPPQQPVADAPVSWEASEYIHHDKDATWAVGLIAVAVVLVGIAIWLGAWTFALLVVIMAGAMGFFAFRPPRVQRYTLTEGGVQIGEKFYSYNDFRAFGVTAEGAFYTMMLIPTKRFMPAITIYFAESDGEKIVDTVGNHLPMEELKPDFIDNVMHRLRF